MCRWFFFRGRYEGRQWGWVLHDLSRSRDVFVVYFWFVRWTCISLGFHVCLDAPNFELHLPFGFIRIGWASKSQKLVSS